MDGLKYIFWNVIKPLLLNISPQEQNGIIYSMVVFKPYQDPSELYANLQIHNPKDTEVYSNSTVTVEESVEYSTIMRAPA